MKILGIGGSLRARSSNAALLRQAGELVPPGVSVSVCGGLGGLPHFNPDLDDLDAGLAPPRVLELRATLGESAALLFVTPEYAHGMPGSLKNALDWLVGSGDLAGKPFAVVSGAPNAGGGLRAQASLIQTLVVLDAVFVDALAVPFLRERMGDDGRLTQAPTLRRLERARQVAGRGGWRMTRPRPRRDPGITGAGRRISEGSGRRSR